MIKIVNNPNFLIQTLNQVEIVILCFHLKKRNRFVLDVQMIRDRSNSSTTGEHHGPTWGKKRIAKPLVNLFSEMCVLGLFLGNISRPIIL